MSYALETLANGMRIARRDYTAKFREQPAGRTARSSFFAELDHAAQKSARTEASGSEDLKSAYDGLSTQSKDLLDRMKTGVSKEEWGSLFRELLDAGLISESEYFHSNPCFVFIGYTDANGDIVHYPPYDGSAGTHYQDPSCQRLLYLKHQDGDSWLGDPFKILDEWLENMRKWQAELEGLVRPNGVKYDTSYLTQQMEDRQKVYTLVQRLAALA